MPDERRYQVELSGNCTVLLPCREIHKIEPFNLLHTTTRRQSLDLSTRWLNLTLISFRVRVWKTVSSGTSWMMNNDIRCSLIVRRMAFFGFNRMPTSKPVSSRTYVRVKT